MKGTYPIQITDSIFNSKTIEIILSSYPHETTLDIETFLYTGILVCKGTIKNIPLEGTGKYTLLDTFLSSKEPEGIEMLVPIPPAFYTNNSPLLERCYVGSYLYDIDNLADGEVSFIFELKVIPSNIDELENFNKFNIIRWSAFSAKAYLLKEDRVYDPGVFNYKKDTFKLW